MKPGGGSVEIKRGTLARIVDEADGGGPDGKRRVEREERVEES